MNCKICSKPIPSHRTYCSNDCKFSDVELNQLRSRKVKNDPTKVARCKLDGKILDDEKNLGGHLSSYSRKTLLKEFDWNDWEIIDKPLNTDERWQCPYCDWSGKTKNGQDNGGWVGIHLNKTHGISKDQHIKEFPEDHVLWPHKLKVLAAKDKINSGEYNRVQCLECGEYFAKISNTHLMNKHNGMTTGEYLIKYPNAKIQSDDITDTSKGIRR